MDTDNYRRCMDVMLLLTFQDSAQFHFGNLVFAPNLYMSPMLDLFVAYYFVGCNVECSAATKPSFPKQLFLFVDLLTFPYVEVSLLLAFSHNYAALAPFQMRIDVFKVSFIFGSHLAIIIKRNYTASYYFSSLLLFSLDPELNA